MANILTNEEVRDSLRLDYDVSDSELERWAKVASSFIKQKTGFDFADITGVTYPDYTEVEPLAVECAIKYVQQSYFSEMAYNKEYDFTLGINSLLVDLQNLAYEISQTAVTE